MIRIIKESIEDDFDTFDFGNEEWFFAVPKECILGATLLDNSFVEKKLPTQQRECVGVRWWTQTSGAGKSFAVYVEPAGGYTVQCFVNEQQGVRPILKINNKNIDVKQGDKLEFGGKTFTIFEDLAICDGIIGKCRFNEKISDGNDYNTSFIKKYVDNWFNKAYAEYEG